MAFVVVFSRYYPSFITVAGTSIRKKFDFGDCLQKQFCSKTKSNCNQTKNQYLNYTFKSNNLLLWLKYMLIDVFRASQGRLSLYGRFDSF